MSAENYGFAARQDGVLDVRTVSETARAAKVNWLVAAGGEVVTARWTDAMINDVFAAALAQSPDLCIVSVRIVEGDQL